MKLRSFIESIFGITALSLGMLVSAQPELLPYDLTIIGQVKYGGSLDRLPISLVNLLKDDLQINFIPSPNAYDFTHVPPAVTAILKNPDKTPGNVALLCDVVWAPWKTPARFVPQESIVKIAYSLLESTAMPHQWVKLLNEKFDLVVVADDYFREVYQKCGVTIPLFVVPHGIEIDDFLAEPQKSTKNEIFTFGCSAAFWSRKNQLALIEAFHEEFHCDPLVKLRLHGRTSTNDAYLKKIQDRLDELDNPQIKLLYKTLSPDEYKAFFTSLDCYVLVSKGEGFSITPREALALGIPCILSHNTAHRTICDTGFVYSVPSFLEEYAAEDGTEALGYNFNCSIDEIRKALRELYEQYDQYLRKAKQAQRWVASYRWQSVKDQFLSLIKPKQVLLGTENCITNDYLMTSSPELYSKYMLIKEQDGESYFI